MVTIVLPSISADDDARPLDRRFDLRRCRRPHAPFHRGGHQVLQPEHRFLLAVVPEGEVHRLFRLPLGLRVQAQPGPIDRLGDGPAFIAGDPAIPILPALGQRQVVAFLVPRGRPQLVTLDRRQVIGSILILLLPFGDDPGLGVIDFRRPPRKFLESPKPGCP